MLRIHLEQTLHCLMAGRVRQSHGWEHAGRRYADRSLLIFLIAGEAEFHFGGRTYDMHAGSVLLIPRQTLYTARTEDTCEYYFFHFTGELDMCDDMPHPVYERQNFSFILPPLQSSCIYLDEFLQTEDRYTEFLSRIAACIEHAARPAHTSRMLLDVEFERILILLGGICERSYDTRQLPQTLERILQYIRAHLNAALTVGQICEHFRLSRSYLARLFKQHLQMTPTAYINNEKLHYAAELLQNTNMNISEVAAYLGYCDVFYFSRLYKRTFGLSPSRDIKK